MKPVLVLLLGVALALAGGTRLTATPVTDPPTIAAAAEPALERAYLRADANAIATATQPLDDALARHPDDAALLYTRAFAHFAATATLRTDATKDQLVAELESAARLLDRVPQGPWSPESDALLGRVLGDIIGAKGGVFTAMSLGPKINRAFDRAAKAAPDNPRLLLGQDLSLLYKPKLFGGDPMKAQALLERAVAIFAREAAAPPAFGPRWGRCDALTLLGIARKKAGDLAGARAAWTAVLQLAPDDAWVKHTLLPSLDHPSGG